MGKILVTGGAGYIGTHTCVELLNAGKEIVVIDNFSNSNLESINNVKKITDKDFEFYKIDMNNRLELNKVFEENNIDAVINFVAYKSVGESIQKPIMYYINNVSSFLILLDIMNNYNVKKIIFSSSATVYGEPEFIPITEENKIGGTTNPYGTSKLMSERILNDIYESDKKWNIAILRYFNPIGAHESGLIGENSNGTPTNLMPYITKVANHELDKLFIFGSDYNTKDGTGIRDYIHVVDLAIGHVKALEKLNKDKNGMHIYNLGTGKGYSVLDIVNTFEKVNEVNIPYEFVDRRLGDVAVCYTNPEKAKNELGFVAKKKLEDMCRDSWNYKKFKL